MHTQTCTLATPLKHRGKGKRDVIAKTGALYAIQFNRFFKMLWSWVQMWDQCSEECNFEFIDLGGGENVWKRGETAFFCPEESKRKDTKIPERCEQKHRQALDLPPAPGLRVRVSFRAQFDDGAGWDTKFEELILPTKLHRKTHKN